MWEFVESYPSSDVQRANSLWSGKRATGNGEKVHSQFIHQSGYLSHRWRRMVMENDAVLFGNLGKLSYGLNGTHLVVRMHNGNQYGLWRNTFL